MPSKKYILSAVSLLALGAAVFFGIISWKSSHIYNTEQFNQWLNNKDNNCIISRSIDGVIVTVKYQPPSYIVLKDADNARHIRGADNLLNYQDKLITFLMTIGPDKNLKNNTHNSVMYEGVDNYSQYVQRVLSTNFFMDQYLRLYIDGVAYKPVICLLENVYELSDERNFMVTFVPDKEQKDKGREYLFVYDDPFFRMGKVQFNFSGKDLAAARNVKVVWD